jgi:hypothetical protein
MKRLFCILFDSLILLSTLLCLATGVLWIRSYTTMNSLGRFQAYWSDNALIQRSIYFASMKGRIGVDWRYEEYPKRGTLSNNRPWQWSALPARNYTTLDTWIPDPDDPKENFQRYRGTGIKGWAAAESHRILGIGFRQTRWDGDLPRILQRALVVPHAWVVTATAILPLMWLAFWLKQRPRHRAGSCAKCGYDLRATPDRCPECGATMKQRRVRFPEWKSLPT